MVNHTVWFNPDSRGKTRSVAHIGKVVPSPNESASRDSDTRSHPYRVVAHLPAQSIINWWGEGSIEGSLFPLYLYIFFLANAPL